jgi:hypothetical protein
VRKLWTARVLVLLCAAALVAVVFEERRQQESEALQRISGDDVPGRVIDAVPALVRPAAGTPRLAVGLFVVAEGGDPGGAPG